MKPNILTKASFRRLFVFNFINAALQHSKPMRKKHKKQGNQKSYGTKKTEHTNYKQNNRKASMYNKKATTTFLQEKPIMKYQIEKLRDVNPELCQQLRNYCYNINGCCQIVHTELGPFLNEYIYQDALEICIQENNLKYQREYYFSIDFHGKRIRHKHFVDFLVKDNIIIECKATENICPEHRQQLWNYMRLTNTPIGILWNFAPVKDQNEHYYLDVKHNIMYVF